MSATAKPVAGPVRTRDGGFQSSRTLARQYGFWIDRFQHFSGPTFIARAKRALPAVSFDSTVVAMALAMQCRRDRELREQGTRGLIELAEAGNNLARYNLAVQRMALPDEQPTAFSLMAVVAETESSDPYLKGLALAGVGECYENGHGVERDVAKAHSYYEQAVEYDVAEAAFNVGLYHDEKVNTHVRGPVDLEKAARYYERGAELGDARCLTNLGILYAARRLGPEKVEEGWRLLERASAAGDSIARDAMTTLGSLEVARTGRHGGDLTSLLHTRL